MNPDFLDGMASFSYGDKTPWPCSWLRKSGSFQDTRDFIDFLEVIWFFSPFDFKEERCLVVF